MRPLISVVLAEALLTVMVGIGSAHAMTVGQNGLNGSNPGESRGPVIPVSIDEYFGRQVAQLFSQPVRLVIGEYQPIGNITPSVVRGDYTISLFTSGFNGAPAPSAVIDGSSITVDLSSLYLSHAWRDEFRIWNVGGLATGTIDLETLEFHLNWDRVFRSKHHDTMVTFALRGTMVPVPIADTPCFLPPGWPCC
ncbi:MAG: hypothetical protein NNA25_11355 [Nitrospira sp.]|nr:hypothetical protein [Nitrospira sp.]